MKLPWPLLLAGCAEARQIALLDWIGASTSRAASPRVEQALGLRPSTRTLSVQPVREVHHPSDDDLYGASIHRDVSSDARLPRFILKSRRRRLKRPRARAGTQAYLDARYATMRDRRGQPHPADYTPLQWDDIEVDAPDVSDMATLQSLAAMSGNAYWSADDAEDGKWYDMGGRFNLSSSFGWADSGLRGHVFATPDNATVVIALKGTSAGPLTGGGGSTGPNDKKADNTFFSCCCARVSWSWPTVCDCFQGGWKCNQECLEDAVAEESTYFPLATDLYNNVTRIWPHANIWLTGHSLGGGVASLLGLTFGVPAVTFESPGDMLPAKRLHLPMPPGAPEDSTAITHVYHTADPIPQGACTGVTSLCSLGGFALETKCHTGTSIVFDTVSILGWSVDVRTHSINVLIEKLLIDDWDGPEPPKAKVKRVTRWRWPHWRRKQPADGEREADPEPSRPIGQVPEPQPEGPDCEDCFKWQFVEGEAVNASVPAV